MGGQYVLNKQHTHLSNKLTIMKTNILICILLLLMISCEKDDNSIPDSIGYKSSFSTETSPIAIAIDKNKGFVYLANHNPSITDFSSKIQKFNLKGELKETIIDFETYTTGKYPRYSPIDLCINNNDIYILVKPKTQNNDTWIAYSGFCVLHSDLNGNIINEFDFSQLEHYDEDFSAMAFSNDFIYVTNGQIIIKKIDKNSGQAEDIQIPITNNKSLLVTDMEVESEESIYLTGQGPWGFDTNNNDASICHITRLNCIENQTYTFYSNSRTGIVAAMPNKPGLTIKDNKYIYLTTFYGRSLEIYDKGNKLILQEEIKPNGVEDTLPIDVALYKSDIYIVDSKNDKVHIYSELK
jgi:hypothetical protein